MSNKTSGRPEMIMANKVSDYGSMSSANVTIPHFVVIAGIFTKNLASRQRQHNFTAFKKVNTDSATVLRTAYGYTIETHTPDPLAESGDKMMIEFSMAAVPMAWAVDIIPILQYLPICFPSPKFQKTARIWRKSIQSSACIPYRFVKTQMATSIITGVAKKTKVLLSGQLLVFTGLPRTPSNHPHHIHLGGDQIQTCAVQGSRRNLSCYGKRPPAEDREKWPYINALVKGITRWWSIAPMGFPHTTTEDVEYNGVHIRKDAFLLPAVW
ncbi:uncharacterized protein TRUGW13939_08588 [Talaromyces rugulosus]|uniref:Uncharacterized protein n=1 Tax=Talaromyces rugulosus TaxID=121627 RepID=A0A7H8R507_TALRU|nr:uncharacterized protein TRUGW13939_08588 [Talaromyces rugulosus]QKX61440.1 hypothetical protein TRUGW13939_08588 [Talaromyces rugulosus]